MGVTEIKVEELTFDIGRQDLHRSTDPFQLWIRLKNLDDAPVEGFSVIVTIDHSIRDVTPNQTLAPGEETWDIHAFKPLPEGEHTLGVYIDPTPDGNAPNVLDVFTPFVPFEFTVHPPHGTHREEPADHPQDQPHPRGKTDVVVSVLTNRNRPLHGFQTYVQFNGAENQTFATDTAGGGSWQDVAIPDTGSVVVWAVPMAGSAAAGSESLTGAAKGGYHVKDQAVRLSATVYENEIEVEAGSEAEVQQTVERKVGGGIKILDIVDLSADQTKTNTQTNKGTLLLKFKVRYTTGDLIVEQV